MAELPAFAVTAALIDLAKSSNKHTRGSWLSRACPDTSPEKGNTYG
jgi:hypothetical protein